jgi:hypothetical protein
MVAKRRIFAGGAFVALAALACGCAMTGAYQSARILEKGTSSLALGFAVHRISVDSTHVFLPAVLPEVSYHLGVARNWEVGGRISPGTLAIQGDCKYRYLHSEKLHLAVAPSVAYQGLFFMSGVTAGLPLIATLDLTDRQSVNLTLFGSYAHLSSSDEDLNDELKKVGGDAGTWGVALGPEIRGEAFFMRPMIEFARSYPLSGTGDRWVPFNRLSVTAQFGWIMGREKQQLDRIEKKLDKALETKPE